MVEMKRQKHPREIGFRSTSSAFNQHQARRRQTVGPFPRFDLRENPNLKRLELHGFFVVGELEIFDPRDDPIEMPPVVHDRPRFNLRERSLRRRSDQFPTGPAAVYQLAAVFPHDFRGKNSAGTAGIRAWGLGLDPGGVGGLR